MVANQIMYLFIFFIIHEVMVFNFYSTRECFGILFLFFFFYKLNILLGLFIFLYILNVWIFIFDDSVILNNLYLKKKKKTWK